jgi:nicotinamide mononucleotide transporter
MNQTLQLFAGVSTTPLELISFLLSVVTVACNIRQIHWGWLFAILSSALYSIVFFDAKLYGDMALQFVFIIVSFWGWQQWLKANPEMKKETSLAVTRCSSHALLLAGFAWLLMFGASYLFLRYYTDTDVPAYDGFLTAGSLLGQVLLSRKKLENWHVWIIVDVLYVALYAYKHLMLTALLYGVFVFMAIHGAKAWGKVCQNQIKVPA